MTSPTATAVDHARWKEKDAGSYDGEVARRYDRWVSKLSAPLAEAICDLARLREGQSILDVGCGSGIATRAAAARVGPTGRVIGIDFSRGMLDIARQYANDPHIDFRHMDAEQLAFPDDCFDAVVSLCAVTHFPDLQRALRGMYRVLKPGGPLIVSFGYARPIAPLPLALHAARRIVTRCDPRHPVLQAPRSLEAAVEQLGATADEAIYAAWSTSTGARVRTLTSAMKRVGLTGVHRRWRGHELRFTSAADFFEAQMAISTIVRKKTATLSAEERQDLRRRYIDETGAVLRRGGRLVYPTGAMFFVGTKPAV